MAHPRGRHTSRRTGLSARRQVAGWSTLATFVVVVVGSAVGAGPSAPHAAARARSLATPSPSISPSTSVGPVDSAPRAQTRRLAAPPLVVTAPRSRPSVPESGSGEFVAAPARVTSGGLGTTFRIEAESGLPIRLRTFARVVRATLGDDRSWFQGDLERLSEAGAEADFRIVLASPGTTDRLCAPLATRGRVSCRNGEDVVINAWRWVNGAPSYGGRVAGYRRYVINHEVGHALGNSHQSCPAPGASAPVMLQQTLGLGGCVRNPWPALVDLAPGR